jgi:PEP-CTERM motif
MDRNKLSFAAALAVGAFLAAPAAHGTILVPGQSGVAPDLFAFLPGATVVGSMSGSFTSVAFTGNYIEEVFVDPANGFGKNDLTWLIQVTNNNGSAGIGRITASSFAGFMTDVGTNDIGFVPPGFVGGALPDPDTVDRDVTGAIIGFNYPFGLGAGRTSVMLEIQTNATAFGAGFISLSGGTLNAATATVPALAPTAAVPEPATWAMLLLGFAGLGFAFGQSRRKVAMA